MTQSDQPDNGPWTPLLDYWRTHIQGGTDDRQDFNPLKDLPDMAKYLTVVDVTGRPYRYVSFSTEVGKKLGVDLTGKASGSSPLIEAVKLEWNRLLESVTRLKTPRLVEIQGDQGTLHYVLALPIPGPAGKTGRIVLGTFFDPHPVTKIVIRGWRKIELDL